MAGGLIKETVTGYEAFKQRITELKATQDKIFVLFTGSKSDGQSWCPDCNDFEDVFKSFKEKHDPTGFFLTVDVGSRDEWKSPQSPFRTAQKLTSIPTLMLWSTPKILSGDAILDEENLAMLFNDEDD